MKKSDINARMADYLEGDLPLEDRALFDAYLDADPESARDVAELRRTIALLRSLPESQPPADLARRVMDRIRAGEARVPWWSRVAAFLTDLLQPRLAGPALVGATAAALVMLVFNGDLRIQPPEPGSGPSGEQLARVQPLPERAFGANPLLAAAARTVATEVPEIGQAPLGSQGAAPTVTRRTQVRIKTRTVIRNPSDTARGLPALPSTPGQSPAPATVVGTHPASSPAGPLAGARPSGPLGLGRAAPSLQTPSPVRSVANAEISPSREMRVDARLDARIADLLADPAAFAGELGGDGLADIWITQIASRIVERQLAEQVLSRLRESADPQALVLADAFAEEFARSDAASVARELEASER